MPLPLGRGQLGLDAIGFLTQLVDSTASSVLVLFQQSDDDGIRNLPGSDDTTRHHSHRVTHAMPDQRKRRPQVRNDNSH
ncbi:hypothetical protein ACWC2T_45095 [Streptomyces sp. NPDC001393]